MLLIFNYASWKKKKKKKKGSVQRKYLFFLSIYRPMRDIMSLFGFKLVLFGGHIWDGLFKMSSKLLLEKTLLVLICANVLENFLKINIISKSHDRQHVTHELYNMQVCCVILEQDSIIKYTIHIIS
jgi:hypothetical protein